MRFAIYEGNMEKLRKKLVTIRNKCRKYDCDFLFEEVGEEFREVENDDGVKITVRFVLVEVEGLAVINDWKFIASIEHTPGGNIIKKVSDEYEVPRRYWDMEPVCEHCHADRHRKYVFLVRNEKSGEWKMVGKQCLKDFTFGLSASAAAALLNGVSEIGDYEEPIGGGWGGAPQYLEVREFLKVAAETIKKFGYIKVDAESGIPTKIRATSFYDVGCGRLSGKFAEPWEYDMGRVGFDPDAQEELVDNALAWIREKEASSDYIHNLKLICSSDFANYNKAGFLASLIVTYEKEMGYLAERKRRNEEARKAGELSGWVGKEKERITVEIASCDVVTSWETDWGHVKIYKIVGKDNNVFTWKTSGYIEDDVKKLVGTVKAHNEYRGVKQTELTRCRVVV